MLAINVYRLLTKGARMGSGTWHMAPTDTECIAYSWYLKGATAFSFAVPLVREPTASSVESNHLP